MSPTQKPLQTVLIVALMLAAAPPSRSQTPAATADPAPAATDQANSAAPAATAPGSSPGSGTADSKAGSALNSPESPANGASAPAKAASGPRKSSPVCFKLTGRCVESAKSPKAAAKAANGKHLNLSAPDVRTVVPAEELQEPLPSSQQVEENIQDQTVQVKGETAQAPDVPGGFGALWWALGHPSQAWRIVTPAE